MKKSKIVALMLACVMVFSLALAGCNSDKETPKEDTKKEEPATDTTKKEDKQEDTKKEEPKEEGPKLAAEQVLKINWGSEPPSLDPQISQDSTSSDIMNDTLEGMIRMKSDGQVKKGSGMAEDWTISEDGLTYTFKLRDNNWTDGQPVTAQDFEFAWKRALDPATASTYAFMAYDIKNGEAFNTGDITDANELGVKAIDAKTLEVVLERPNPSFLSKLQHSTFFPARQDLLEKWGEKYASEVEYLVTCGPFNIVEWEHESKLVLEKNPNYWNADVVKLQRVEGVMIKDSNTKINLYETDELDSTLVPSQYIDKYKDVIAPSPKASCFYYTFNTQNEFFKSQKIRQAFAKAIDRTKILELRTKGMTPPAFGLVPPGMPGIGEKTFREINGNLFKDLGTGMSKEEVNKLLDEGLAEVGKTREDMNGIKFLTFDSDTSLTVAQIWQQYWKENLGVDVEIQQSTFKIKIDLENKRDFAFSYSGWIGDYNDPMTFMDMFITDGPQNTASWTNEEYDRLIKLAQTSQDADERMQAMLDAEKILMDELPIAPYNYSVELVLQKPYVKNIIRLPLQVTRGLSEAYILEH